MDFNWYSLCRRVTNQISVDYNQRVRNIEEMSLNNQWVRNQEGNWNKKTNGKNEIGDQWFAA